MNTNSHIRTLTYKHWHTNTRIHTVADPEENSAMAPIQFRNRLWPHSNKEINLRYWKTY